MHSVPNHIDMAQVVTDWKGAFFRAFCKTPAECTEWYISMNDFVKPKDQREFIRFGLARNRTFKNISARSLFAAFRA